MSLQAAGPSSAAGLNALPAVEIPGSKPKPVNYKALHYDASTKWRFDYQGRARWTLELMGLRRELDHMGDKILALIADLSLNR